MKQIQKYGLVLLASLPMVAQAAYYRWIDTKGVVHYSYSVPPSDAQLGHVELSKSGIKQKVVISAKRKKQLKEIAELNKIKRKTEKEQAKLRKLQEEEDIRLLSIYNNEEEVVKAYNAKLRMAQLTIDLLKSRHKVQSDKLEKLELQFEHAKDITHRNAIESRMDDVLDNLRIYQQAITENYVEKDKVHKEFKETLNRFKRLQAKQLGKKIVESKK